MPKPIAIGDDFQEKCLSKGFKAEENFRFVGKCAKSSCSHWQENRCSISDRAAKATKEMETNSPLPVCSIRPNCRWYQQEKSNACKFCKFIVTEASSSILNIFINNIK